MSTIQREMQAFFSATGLKQVELAREADIAPSSISNLLRGKRKELRGTAQDRLRAAMRRLEARHRKRAARAAAYKQEYGEV